MVKAVIYDLDDLMVNSAPLHFEAWEVTLNKFGHSFKDLPKGYMTQFMGTRVIDSAIALVRDLNLKVSVETIFKIRNKIFLGMVRSKLQPMGGLLYSLKLLKKNGFKIALASSATKQYLDFVLKKFNLGEYFDVLVSGDDVRLGKPHPQTYLIACKKLNLKPSECLVLEDATHGIDAAKRAGCKCIGVENSFTPYQDRSKADKILPSLKALTLDIVNTV